MRNFFLDIKNSIYGPDYYKSLLDKSLSYSLKYFVLFGLLICLLIAVVFAAAVLPDIKSVVNNFIVKAVDYYPAELQLTIKNSQVSTNVPEPYFIPAPTGFSEDNYRIENIVVIDTLNSFSLEKFQEYKTLVWITKSGVAFMDSDTGPGGVRYQPLEGVPDTTITKQEVQKFWTEVRPILNTFLNLAAGLVFVLAALWLGWLLLYLFGFALVIRLLVNETGKFDVGYKKAYQLGLHIFTLPILALPLLNLLHVSFPFLFSLLALVLAFLNLRSLRPAVSEQPTDQAVQA